MGRIDDVTGTSTSYSDDGFGNVNRGDSVQTYDTDLLHATGLQKILRTDSHNVSTNVDGSSGETWSRQFNIYTGDQVDWLDQNQGGDFILADGGVQVLSGDKYQVTRAAANTRGGILVNVVGDSNSLSNDGFWPLLSQAKQNYDTSALNLLGLQKLYTTQTWSFSSNALGQGSYATAFGGPEVYPDGTWNRQYTQVTSQYDAGGRLLGGTGTGTTLSNDGATTTTARATSRRRSRRRRAI